MAKRTGLGKGLDALFIDNHTEDGNVSQLKITQIEPNHDQPRREFDDGALRELADSIREHGVIQPLVVRAMENGMYQIVAGERRWRAARMAGLTDVPVVVRELTDEQTLEIAIIENLQREDLNIVELANGYKTLMESYDMTQEQVAERMGKSRPVIANTIRILSLPAPVLDKIREGKISKGHAKALLSLEDDALIQEVASKVVSGSVLVRDIEKLARKRKQESRTSGNIQKEVDEATTIDPIWGDNYYKEMEIALSTELGRKVKITDMGKKASIELEFYSHEELADIAARLTKSHW
ncbi:ParB/RepB/Spo0J family partition protein [Ruminococcaceae bacterium OttesenSCG-928-L11]|nr:ParB/RepB/Spo0J family partition protein [Ruminococcaceae bacterium OttesenSCG-928-L11]